MGVLKDGVAVSKNRSYGSVTNIVRKKENSGKEALVGKNEEAKKRESPKGFLPSKMATTHSPFSY